MLTEKRTKIGEFFALIFLRDIKLYNPVFSLGFCPGFWKHFLSQSFEGFIVLLFLGQSVFPSSNDIVMLYENGHGNVSSNFPFNS